jgi:hypothetical protein
MNSWLSITVDRAALEGGPAVRGVRVRCRTRDSGRAFLVLDSQHAATADSGVARRPIHRCSSTPSDPALLHHRDLPRLDQGAHFAIRP